MKSNLIFTLLIASILFMLSSCKSSKPTALTTSNPALANAPVIIYKTKADYFLHVPVNMTQDRKSLSSYPAPGDVFYAGDLALPVQLEDCYLLDRRGINELSAFTKWTYYEYSRLPNTPSQAEIMNMLLDTDPFTEIYFCGKRGDFNNLVEDLNKIIKKGKLSNFQRVK